LLDIEHPPTYGPLDHFDYYFEHKRQQIDAMWHAKSVFKEVCADFEKTFGRKYDVLEKYRMDDATKVIVTMSSTAGTTKEVVDELRSKGEKVGLMKLRLFRPFPYEEVKEALKDTEKIAVLDRSASFGANNPLFIEVKSALYGTNKTIRSYLFGLGGRDINTDHIKNVFSELSAVNETTNDIKFINLRD
jgi:pyruvate ferredoxin oxidoreductase alpha subunit